MFFDYATVSDEPWSSVINNLDIKRKEYIRMVLEESLEPGVLSLQKSEDIQLDLWQRYRQRYNWQPRFRSSEPPTMITDLHYLNGEKDYLFYPLDASLAQETRAIPLFMILVWESEQQGRSILRLQFDEQETMSAFSQIIETGASADQPEIFLDFNFDENNSKALMSVSLSSETKTINLKKVTESQAFGVKTRR